MDRRVSKIEIIMTAIIFAVACVGIGLTAVHRVDKTSGALTTENYADYMRVDCSLGGCLGGGDTMQYDYYITLTADRYYRLENVTVSYSLQSDGADLPDGTIVATVGAGQTFSEKFNDKFTVALQEGSVFWEEPTLTITVKSVTGTFAYDV